MWLLNVKTLELEEFVGDNIPDYVILSHRWGSDEVSFVDMKKPKYREPAKHKAGFAKIERCCLQAQSDGYAWAWVDSCCIDKRSSAELSEAINSMFQWYQRSSRCYVYLSDVPSGSEALPMLRKSGWFTRGWTLQELLAPETIVFFAHDWIAIGYKESRRRHENRRVSSLRGVEWDGRFLCPNLAVELSGITGIPTEFLVGDQDLGQACVAQRMFWASYRETTRAEDRAYSLMGLFNVNMPILYGEGLEKAFTRLQREIMSKTPDQSIFAWYRSDATSYRLLAESPDCFRNSGTVTLGPRGSPSPRITPKWSSFSMTNLGLRVTLPITPIRGSDAFSPGDGTLAVLNCLFSEDNGTRRNIGLNILFLDRDLEECPIFVCDRPCRWTLIGGEMRPMDMLLCGNDYISDLPKKKIATQAGIPEPRSIESQLLHILADETGFSRDDITDEHVLTDLGVDSLMRIIIVARIRNEMQLDLGIRLLTGDPSIRAIKRYLGMVPYVVG
ncbi:heterokaryon incompatibility protein-domain-containing protein [Durotheca rogersii]|uniref:heterokaryon incompatibility protein-domain-containing protein n=1 Tax=Durotheca rogersii TaxID=419775 RepID=UPI00221E9EF8|nr:heterokaryon incompatibility protein-domain-containing protein [Durotheca rogersii]KAI5860457.1 heterokaryon incompatibility protein-domain-containing protein [Durotheca rogersii]